MHVRGLPAIESSVDKQLSILLSNSPSFKDVVVIRRRQIVMNDHDNVLDGSMQYDALLGGTSVDLFVSWRKSATNCVIMKIESNDMASGTRLLWKQ
jgi:hypothetical protein